MTGRAQMAFRRNQEIPWRERRLLSGVERVGFVM